MTTRAATMDSAAQNGAVALAGDLRTGSRTGPRWDRRTTDLLAQSARVTERGAGLATADFAGWLADRGREHAFRVRRIDFAELKGWNFRQPTGNLVHQSGRFFTVEGLRVRTSAGFFPEWHQPIIRQPDVGILGILAKEIDGVLHFLMQAKMEPGNPNLLQLSPTVQATRSNYTRVHRGAPVRYVEYFAGPRQGRILADVLQSEHGSWFYRKHNRNMIVETRDEVPPHPDFCWLTLGQLYELLRRDNTVNMDSRTVLSSLPPCAELPDSRLALTPDAEVLSWLTEHRSTQDWTIELVPLTGLPGWARTEREITREDGRFFDVVAVAVEAGNREVPSWTQPLIEPHGEGVAAFLLHEFDGVPHVLAHARMEGGLPLVVEVAPTVQCVPANYPEDRRPRYLDEVLAAPPARIRYNAVHAEEGGRFRNAVSRYLVVEPDGALAAEPPPPGYAWLSVRQLERLTSAGLSVNVQARTLLACLRSVARPS
ncbi:NDP-hexose 2,3-dehydratase family protein [Streptomyces sp. R1]|uniref:NDP-hexose 2,3-dehydratase family protein n=1 Tax=unclassified Streptomyces TaxID=2593676 RepID=UPI001E5E0161|nr:NDP-hexose 2,3-dehydratase family protein [Streptomyces sp. R1]MCC8336959.1 NDP-hexose 2,3-dehydratase family protein [Streptomyces sp. R1]